MGPPPGYTELSLCGAGATSRVFRALEVRSGAPVALKRLHRQLAHSSDAVSRLKREFEALARLRHPGIVRVRDVIRWQGDPTVVMDFVPGRDLEDRIAKEGPLPAPEVERIARALLGVLGAAHAAGIVHRDVKPQNVRLAEDGRVFLLDFGSARLDAHSELTATGTSVGTPDYMAPELFAGAVYDPRVDLYGLGATLFRCLTGRAPQSADSLTELAYRRTREDAPRVESLAPNTPRALARVVDRALARAPEARFASAALMTWALDHAEIELAFSSHRDRLPPCLHCHERAPAEVEVCPACGSDHPFSYAPGSSHLVLRSVDAPGRLAAELARHFPERTTPEHLYELSERIAALSHERQRLISFIDPDEAAKLQRSLGAVGVGCEVETDSGTMGWHLSAGTLVAAVLGFVAMASVLFGIELDLPVALLLVLPAVIAIALDRFGAVLASSRGLLADSRLPAPIAPGASQMLGMAAAGTFAAGAWGAPWAAGLGASATAAAFVGNLGGALYAGGAAFGLAALIAATNTFARAPRSAAGSPEPPLSEKLRCAFFGTNLPRGRRGSAQVAVLLTATVLALVPVELGALGMLQNIVPDLTAKSVAVTSVPGTMMLAPAQSAAISAAPAVAESVAPALAPATALPLFPATVASPSVPLIWTWAQLALALGLVGSAFGSLMFLGGRRRRLRQEAGIIAHELDALRLESLQVPASRPATSVLSARAPARLARQPVRSHFASRPATSVLSARAPARLARQPVRSDFSRAARRRATVLASWLPEDASERLRRVIAALHHDDANTGDAERSFLARCILESDPEQRLRFDFLALEGEMEREAAVAWLSSMEDEGDELP